MGSGVIIDENGHILPNNHHVGTRYNIYTSPTALYQKAEEIEFADFILGQMDVGGLYTYHHYPSSHEVEIFCTSAAQKLWVI